MISSSDTRWRTANKSRIENKLKSIASKIHLNTSDSKETLDGNKSFLKGGTMTAIWNDVVNCIKIEECTENKNGWWNTVMLESNGKRLAIITLYRIVDANTASVNSCKAQYERKCGKIKRAKEIRAEMLKELKQEIREMNTTDIIVAGDFNEDVNAKKIQEFVVEIGLCEVFGKVHEVDKNDRDGTLEYGTKCIDYVLVSEGMLNVAEGIELIECNKIVDSDHFGYLTDLNLETYFEEEFNKEREIEYRSLNPKKRTHRKKFAEMCKELLNVIPIEHELEHIERHKDRAKMEQLDKDITFVL